MSANLDRFSCGLTPTEPNEVGHCEACQDMMYGYEVVHCKLCDAEIHDGCQEKCRSCGLQGCGACLTQNPEDQEYYCENCKG